MTDEQAPAPWKSFFKGGIHLHFKRMILHPELTPERVALSFAIVLLCFLFKRLHRPLMLLACFINNPWTMVPMASVSGLVGNLLMGRGCRPKFHGIRWDTIGWQSFVSKEGFDHMYLMLKPILGPYLLGGVVLSALALPVGYYVMLKIAIRLRQIHLHRPAVKLPVLHLPKSHPDRSK